MHRLRLPLCACAVGSCVISSPPGGTPENDDDGKVEIKDVLLEPRRVQRAATGLVFILSNGERENIMNLHNTARRMVDKNNPASNMEFVVSSTYVCCKKARSRMLQFVTAVVIPCHMGSHAIFGSSRRSQYTV